MVTSLPVWMGICMAIWTPVRAGSSRGADGMPITATRAADADTINPRLNHMRVVMVLSSLFWPFPWPARGKDNNHRPVKANKDCEPYATVAGGRYDKNHRAPVIPRPAHRGGKGYPVTPDGAIMAAGRPFRAKRPRAPGEASR